MRTQVAIVGAGPAGLTLGLLLERAGIESVVLEAHDRDYVERRVRAGVLEQNTVDLLSELGVGERLARESLAHHAIDLRTPERTFHIPLTELTGRSVTVYGQQEVVKDLIAARLAAGLPLLFEAPAVALDGLDGERPRVRFELEGAPSELECDFVAGCDGFHGISRAAVPAGVLAELDHGFPFAWLGILAQAPPATETVTYAWHPRGFALHSMRSRSISRLYLQVPADERLDAWPDERIWDELERRLGAVNRGPVIDRGITPLRSFVCEPMQHGRLFLCGDAAHIVPPTGAKGLNLAVNDARLLATALEGFLHGGSPRGLTGYSTAALRRVWRAQDFSGYLTQLLHDLGGGAFERSLQLARLDYLGRSEPAARSFAENYVGLPAAPDF
jgi:p-hydroxybenzoate 3-monooxygenase